MSLVVHFSPDLGSWLDESLKRGLAPASLVHTMVARSMDANVARAIVDAFLVAGCTGKPIPRDSVTVDEGEMGFVRKTPVHRTVARIETVDRTVRVVARTEQPTLAVLADLVAADECDALIALAKPRLMPSTVVDPKTGKDVVATHRTSFGTFFRLGETPLIARLDRRFSEVMNRPVAHGEGFQVLFYPEGAETSPHVDFLRPTNVANRASIARSGQRVSTLIAYLNDVPSGGETVFPAASVSVAPIRGHGVLFEYHNDLDQTDEASVHAGNRVVSGEKWVLTKWMRARPFVSVGDASSEGMGI